MKVAPFHSKLPGTDVHHDDDSCTVGNNIESYNRVSGTGRKTPTPAERDERVNPSDDPLEVLAAMLTQHGEPSTEDDGDPTT